MADKMHNGSLINQDFGRVNYWDNLKFILITFVIIHHASIPYVVVKNQHWTEVLYMIIMPYTMTSFTIISGYWFKPKPVSLLARRFLLPALIVIFLFNGLKSYSPISFINQYHPWNSGSTMWYLWALFIYYLITPKLLKIRINVLLPCSVAVALLAGFVPAIGGAFALGRLIGFYPFFLLGVKLRQTGWIDERRSEKRSVIMARIIFVALLALYLVAFLYYRPLHLYTTFSRSYEVLSSCKAGLVFRSFTYVICTVLSVALIIAIPNKRYRFTKYGSRSLTAYIIHPMFLIVFCWNLMIPFMDKWYGYVCYMLVIPCFCLLMMNKPTDDFVKKITS